MKHAHVIVIAAVVLGLAALSTPRALAEDKDGLPDLTAQWWQNVLSIPTTVNPLLDPAGDYCMVGQRGSVWFLYGSWDGQPKYRTCSAPADRQLFFPVVNYVNINTPGVCGQVDNYTARQLRAMIKPIIDGATNLSVTIDGRRVKDLDRIESIVFEVTYGADNIFVAPCAGDSPPGTYSPAVDDGYYVLLKGLEPGTHTLHIHGELPSINAVQDITYYLNIVPVSLK